MRTPLGRTRSGDVPSVNRLGKHCYERGEAGDGQGRGVPSVNRLGKHCYVAVDQELMDVVDRSQALTAWASIATLTPDLATRQMSQSRASTAWASIATRRIRAQRAPIARSQASTAWASIATLGRLKKRGPPFIVPSVNRLGKHCYSQSVSGRRRATTYVPSVNRLGKHCYHAFGLRGDRFSMPQASTDWASIATREIAAALSHLHASQASTDWASIATRSPKRRGTSMCTSQASTDWASIATVPRSRLNMSSGCSKRQPIGQALLRRVRFDRVAFVHVPSVNRLGKHCYTSRSRAWRRTSTSPKRQPIGQALLPAGWSLARRATANVPSVNRLGKHCYTGYCRTAARMI